MIRAELIKVFIKNKMLLLAVAVVLLGAFLQFTANTYSQFTINSDQDFYMSYMTKLNGKSDDNKIKTVEKLKADYDNIQSDLSTLEQQYNSGKITLQQYNDEQSRLSEFSSKANVVDTLQACADYVKENPGRHYFIDYVGWTQVFQTYGFDFIILIFVLVISVSSIVVEYNADMTVINSVSKVGRSKGATAKIAVVMIATALLVIAAAVIHLAAYSMKYDLTGWSFPLESLKSYSGSTKLLTIGEAYLLAVLIKALGYCSFAVFTMFFTVLIKKAVYAMSISISLILAPMYILNSSLEGQLRFLLPLPIGLMMTTGYISGTQQTDFSGDYLFREVSWTQMMIVFLVLLVITLLMGVYVSRKLSGKSFSFRLRRKVLLPVACTAISILMCSCAADDFTQKADNYIIVSNLNMIYSKSDDDIIKLDELPIDSQSELGFISGKYAYVKSDKTISKIDLRTLNKSEFIQVGNNIDNNGFLGMDDLVPELSAASIDTSAASLSHLIGGYKNNLYFSSLNGVVEYNIDNGKITKLINGDSVGQFSISENYAYYINAGNLYKINLDTKEETLLTQNKVESYALANDDIYYINLSDNGYPYSLGKNKAVISKAYSQICYNGESLICATDDKVYSVSEGEEKLITDLSSGTFLTADQKFIYILSNNESAQILVLDIK